jgi:hypothetical protein
VAPVSVAGPDPSARGLAIAIAGGRLAIGFGAAFATRRALALLGFERPAGATVALARLAGGRDLALGAHALAASGDPRRLREAVIIGALVDAGDAAAFAAALLSRDGIDRTAALNLPVAAGAAIAGAWVAGRLSPAAEPA